MIRSSLVSLSAPASHWIVIVDKASVKAIVQQQEAAEAIQGDRVSRPPRGYSEVPKALSKGLRIELRNSANHQIQGFFRIEPAEINAMHVVIRCGSGWRIG